MEFHLETGMMAEQNKFAVYPNKANPKEFEYWCMEKLLELRNKEKK